MSEGPPLKTCHRKPPCTCPRDAKGNRTTINPECRQHWGEKGIGYLYDDCCCLQSAIVGRLDDCSDCPHHGDVAKERVRERDSSWEARMAARARERAQAAREQFKNAQTAEEIAEWKAQAQRPWLNGWTRTGRIAVSMGTDTRCVCCGRCMGVTCVVFPPDWAPPGPEPVWPFSEDDCPICVVVVGDLS